MKYFLMGLFAALSVSLTAQSTITPEIIADLHTVGQTAISPDGKMVAYTLRIPGGEAYQPGKSWLEIYTLPLKGVLSRNAAPSTLVPRRYVGKPHSGHSISWSPDGDFIYFLGFRKDVDAHTQVFRIPVDGGEAEQVTGHENGVSSYRLSPDGRQVAFVSRDVKSRQEKIDASQGKDWIVYGQNYKYARLYIQEISEANSKLVFEDDLEVTSFLLASRR